MSDEIEKENFNPKFLKIKDYKTVEEYKNDSDLNLKQS